MPERASATGRGEAGFGNAGGLPVETPLLNLEPSWNVAPTQFAPVVRRHPETGERHLDLLEWGLLRWWQKGRARSSRPINVRAEALARHGVLGVLSCIAAAGGPA